MTFTLAVLFFVVITLSFGWSLLHSYMKGDNSILRSKGGVIDE